MKITDLSKTEKIRMNMVGAKDTWKQIPISSADGTPNFSFRVFTIEPGGHTPYHSHEFEHVNYVIAGAGVVVTLSGEELPVKEGCFALVLPGEKHQYRNTSSEENLVIICAVPKQYE